MMSAAMNVARFHLTALAFRPYHQTSFAPPGARGMGGGC
jgi:hypothetical protein